MNIEELIGRCEAEAGQIKNYDPDPYYVDYFFRSYLDLVNMVYDGIFEEADRDFGLFVKECNRERFKEKSMQKNDPGPAGFVSWYEGKIKEEHADHYPGFMHGMLAFYSQFKRLPGIMVMIRARDRYKNDTCQQIQARLSGGRLCSREELQVEINRQVPVFVEIINRKRKDNGEPAVPMDGIVASAFFKDCEDFEISYAAKVYIQVLRRMVSDSRKKIGELTARQ